jgi:hypothetical protein
VSVFATWLFLGLVLPQLGVEREALKSERFLRMDRSAGQNPADEWFVQMAKDGDRGVGNASTFVNSGRVSAVVITTGQFERDLDRQIEQDSRCKRTQEEGFLCKLDGPLGAVHVETCGNFVVVYSDDLPQGRAQKSAYCGSVIEITSDIGEPETTWFQRRIAPERSIPAMVVGLALVVAGWFAVRRRSKRAERTRG